MKKSIRVKNKCKRCNKILKIGNLCFILCSNFFELIRKTINEVVRIS